jgi:transposase
VPRSRPPYPPEFRAEAVRLVREGLRQPEELARDLGCTGQTIRNWLKQADLDAGRCHDGLTTAEREELRRLRAENRTLRMERDLLRKATAFFAYMSTMAAPCGLARFFAAQVRLWLFSDAPPTRHPGPLGVI